jgi:hypothetical protein
LNEEPLHISEIAPGVTRIVGTPAQFLAANRAGLAASPDDEYQKFFLAISLIAAGERSESVMLSSK